MSRIVEDYTLNQKIGEGVYGKVYHATKNGDNYAVKVVPVQTFKDNPKLEECTVNEIETLSCIPPNEHIIKYIQMLGTPNNYYFVYEYCNGGTLEKLLKKENKLSEPKALVIYRQVVDAFKVLYKSRIMHRDLKPDNILFHNGQIKLGDFGFCKSLETTVDMAATMLGSPIYMAPEVLKGESYTSKADIWSLGVVLFQMLFGFCPFQSNSIAKLVSVLRQNELKIPLDVNPISEKIQTLLRRMLTKQPNYRIDWPQLFVFVDEEEKQSSEQTKAQNPVFKKPAQKNKLQFGAADPKTLNLSFKNDVKKAYSFNDKSKKNQATKSFNQFYDRKKDILQEHTFCMKTLRTSVQFIKLGVAQGNVFAYLILDKCERRLKKMIEDIKGQKGYEDINQLLNQQLGLVQSQISDFRIDLIKQNVDLIRMMESKTYLDTYFFQNQKNLHLWFQMVNFLFGPCYESPQQFSQIQLIRLIKNRMA